MTEQRVKNRCTPILTIGFLLTFAMMQKLTGAAEAGDIVTITRYTGEILGPYILKEMHSHEDDVHNDTLTGIADALIGNPDPLTGITNALTGNGEALTGNADALTGNGEALTGNADALTRNGEALTGNADALTRNAEALTGNADALTGNAEALTGNADALTGNAEALTGNADALTGNAEALTGNADALTGNAEALTGNADALTGNADALTGNAEEGSGDSIFIDDSEGEDEDEAGLQEFPLPHDRDTITWPELAHERNGTSSNDTGNSKPSIAPLPTAIITNVASRTSTSQQVPSLKSTPLTIPDHSTTVSPTTSYQSSSTTQSSSCHEQCVSILHSTKVHVIPAESFIREGSSMRLLCEVKNKEEGAEQVIDDIQLFWLFQKQDPSASECSIDVTPYLELCTEFTNGTAERRQNATHISTVHMLTGLKQHNTGLYMCQVRAHCCGSVPQHQLQHHVTVWQSDYTIELIVMASVAAVLAVLLGIDVYNNWKERKARRDSYKKMVSVLPSSFPTAGGGGKVLHLPLQQDNDDDTASFTSDDSSVP